MLEKAVTMVSMPTMVTMPTMVSMPLSYIGSGEICISDSTVVPDENLLKSRGET